MDPQWIVAACAAAGLVITWTTTTATAAIWIMRRLESIKTDILDDFKKKHEENRIRIEAMQHLVIRHETLLDPEFNGTGGRMRAGRQ